MWLGKYIRQFLQGSGMYFITDFCAFWSLMVMNLIFTFRGRDFAPPVPILLSIYSRSVGREVAFEEWGKDSVHLLFPVFQHCLSRYSPLLFFLSWLTYLVFFTSFAKFSFSFTCTFLSPSLQNSVSSLLFPKHLFYLQHPVFLLLFLLFDRGSQLSHGDLLPRPYPASWIWYNKIQYCNF